MTALRILNIIVWGAMLLYMLTGAVAAVTSRARYGDPMRLACGLTAVVFIAFNLYWLFSPARPDQGDLTLNALLLLSASVGGYILKLGTTYGRGPVLRQADD